MWYLFDAQNQCYGYCNGAPSHNELAERGEIAIESALKLPISEVSLDVVGNIIHITPRPPTPEEIQKTFTDAVQVYMDKKAKERGYDNILSACSYANSTDPVFQSEGLACIAWRDAVWRTCYDTLGEVTTGLREIPTVEELLEELPELVWPKI